MFIDESKDLFGYHSLNRTDQQIMKWSFCGLWHGNFQHMFSPFHDISVGIFPTQVFLALPGILESPRWLDSIPQRRRWRPVWIIGAGPPSAYGAMLTCWLWLLRCCILIATKILVNNKIWLNCLKCFLCRYMGVCNTSFVIEMLLSMKGRYICMGILIEQRGSMRRDTGKVCSLFERTN